MATRTELERLENKLSAVEVSNDQDFRSALLNAMNVFCMRDEDVSNLFHVSRPTVNRWKNGKAAPQVALRPMIFKEFTRRVRAALRDLGKQEKKFVSTSAGGAPRVSAHG